MELKAALKIQLLANDVIVAESDDPVLWNAVLQTAQKGAEQQLKLLAPIQTDAIQEKGAYFEAQIVEADSSSIDEGLAKFAKNIGISPEEIEGACYPSRNEPFLQIDQHYWATFKSKSPKRGKDALPDVVLAATLLAQWFKYAKLGDPTYTQVKQVLQGVGVSPTNPSRSFNGCSWLAKHGEAIKLNPSAIFQADAVVKAFCTKQPIQG